MAKFAYDVNTARRVIDVQKQFGGGLKTVDTDDSLGAVYLRDAENVSLSEFGFIEKRYGTVEKFQLGLGLPLAQNTKLQGYWEFLGKYIIVALNGYLYWQLLSDPDSPFTKITSYEKDENLKYPTNIPVYEGFFQSERPMGAVALSRVLYIFTGKYPVYLTEENNQIRSHFFSKDEPIFAELVVTGHNLLEDDYDALYYNEKFNTEVPGLVLAEQGEDIDKLDEIEVTSIVTSPGLPFAQGGTLDFDVSYNVKPIYNTPFDLEFDQNGVPQTSGTPLYKVRLNALKLRPSGPGATDIDYKPLATGAYISNELNNVDNDTTANVNLLDLDAFSSDNLDFIDLTASQTPAPGEATATVVKETQELKEAYFNPHMFFNGSVVRPRIEEHSLLATFTKQDITIEKDDIPFGFFSSGRRIGLHFLSEDSNNLGLNGSDTIDFEETTAQAKTFLNSFLANGSWKSGVQSRVVRVDSNRFSTQLWLETTDGRKFPMFQRVFTTEQMNTAVQETGAPFDENDIGGITIEYRNIGATRSKPGYAVTDYNGNYIVGSANIHTGASIEYIEEDNPNTLIQASSIFDFQRRWPMFRAVRNKLNEFRAAKGTTIELYEHNQSNNQKSLVKRYTLQDGIDVVEGKYFITLPDANTLPNGNVNNHFQIIFKTVQIGMETEGALTNFYDQKPTNSQFMPTEGYFTLTEYFNDDRTKDFYPFTSEFYRAPDGIKKYPEADIVTDPGNTLKPEVHFGIFEQVNFSLDLAPLGDLGSQRLSVQVKPDQLLSGTYDFLLEYILERKEVNSSFVLSDLADDIVFNGVAKGVTITEERLSDFEFFEDADSNATHPIWSCNQVIEHFDKLVVWGSEEMPTSVFYSFPDRPFYFPSKFYLEFANRDDNAVTSVVPFMNILVVQTAEQTWGIRGNSGLATAPSPYAPFPINSTVGTIAPKSVRPVRNHLYFLSKQGVIALKSLYAADEQYNIEFVDRSIRNSVPQDTEAVGIQFDNQYWLNFPDSGITLRWYIDKKAWVQDRYGAWSDFKGVFKYQIKNGKLEFITWPSTFEGSNKEIYKIGVDEGMPSDLTKTISSKFETSFLNQNYPFHQKNYKEAKLDFTLQNEYSANVALLYNKNSVTISNNIHTIDASELELDNSNKAQQFLESHTYSLSYDDVADVFTSYEADFDGQTFTTYDGNYTGQTFSSFDADFDFALDNIRYINTDNQAFLAKILTNNGETITFVLPVGVEPNGSLEISGNYKGYSGAATIKDVTFDETLNIKLLVLSENGPLNIQDFSSYEQTKASLDFNFGTQFNDWTFGSSGFGNKVSSVNTVKLAGKGYNAKLFLEETSKTKWTLESLGLTYKMKRARSR